VICIHPETKEPHGDLAWEIVSRLVEKGVLVFAPVGYGGSTVKIAPPLSISGLAVRAPQRDETARNYIVGGGRIAHDRDAVEVSTRSHQCGGRRVPCGELRLSAEWRRDAYPEQPI